MMNFDSAKKSSIMYKNHFSLKILKSQIDFKIQIIFKSQINQGAFKTFLFTLEESSIQ